MRLLLTISLFLLTLSAFSQTGNFDYLTSNRRFTLAGRTVKGISNDTALLTASADSLVTQYAIRGYIDQRLLNTPDSSYIFDPEQFIVNGWNVSIRFPQDPGEPLFTGSPAYNLTQAHIDFLDSLMLALRDSNYTYFDDRDFYNDGSAALPFRIVRYDNHYIDSLFASVPSGGGSGSGGPYHLPYNADTSYYLGGDSALHKLQTVGSNGSYHLPYNNDTTYVLAGDSTLHKLPTYTPFDSTSLSSRINQKQNKIKLTTLGQTGASTLINDTLNIPNYFFATNAGDSIDYSFSSMTAIYSEAGPGEAIIHAIGVTANKDNLNFPFKQLKSLDVGGWNSGDYVSFSWPTAKNSTSYTFLRGFVRLKQAVPIIQSLSFQFFNAGVAVSQILSMVNYGLDKSKVDVYQNITIPMSAFGFNTNGFDEIRLIFGGGSSASGLYLDLFQFQNATVEENKYVTDVFRSPGTTNVYEVLGGQNKLAFTDSIGTPVDTQYLRRDININTTAIAGKENAITASNTTGKYWNGYKQFVSLNTDSVTEATNKYYTDTKARAALTLTTTGTSGAASYNSSTGVLNVPNYTGKRFGYPGEDISRDSSGDIDFQQHEFGWYNTTDFYLQASLLNQGLSGITANSQGFPGISHWNVSLYANDYANSKSSALFLEADKFSIQSTTLGNHYIPLSVNGNFADASGNITVTTGGGSTYTDAQARAAISLTTTGTSGAATYNNSTGVLNVPQYATSVGTITWLGTAYNINSANNITLATPTTSDISEGSNLYFTNARARAAISVTGSGTYDNTTGVINITGGSSSGWALGGNTLTNSGAQYIGTNNNTSFRVKTNTTERVVVDSTGKVTINTPTAGNALTVTGIMGINYTDANFAAGLNIKNLSTSSGSLTSINFLNSSGTATGAMVYVPSNYTTVSQRNSVLFQSLGTNLLGFNSSGDGGVNHADLYFRSGSSTDAIHVFGSTNNVGINTATDVASAAFNIVSTTKGALLPRMTNAQMNAIASPTNGLIIFNTDSLSHFQYANGWQNIRIGGTATGSGWGLSGNTGGTNVFGLTSNNSLRMYTNNTERLVIDSLGAVGIGTTSVASGNKLEVAGQIWARNAAVVAQNTTGQASIYALSSDNFQYANTELRNSDATRMGLLSLRKDIDGGLGLMLKRLPGTDIMAPLMIEPTRGRTLIRAGDFVGASEQANASAALEVKSTQLGFLPPRMTTAQRDAIASPAEGLEIYNLTIHQKNYYNGTSWIAY